MVLSARVGLHQCKHDLSIRAGDPLLSVLRCFERHHETAAIWFAQRRHLLDIDEAGVSAGGRADAVYPGWKAFSPLGVEKVLDEDHEHDLLLGEGFGVEVAACPQDAIAERWIIHCPCQHNRADHS